MSKAAGPIAVAASLVAGIAAYAWLQTRSPAPAVQAEPPVVEPGTAPAAKLAATVPAVTLSDRDGKPRSLADWPGKSLIVNFWATWCAPCRKEIPLLQKLQRDRAGDGFQVIGIAVDFREDVLKFADEMRIDYPLLIGEQDALDAAAAFGIDAVGFPFTVFSDASGRVVLAHVGELTAPEADLILGEIQAVNAGRKTLEQARSAIDAGLAAAKASGKSG